MSACRCVLLASMLAMLAACATSPTVPPREAVYNGEETRALTVCLAMGHTAATLAQKKLDDLPIDAARKLYEATPDEGMKQFQLATVDKVYSETVTNWWDYSLAFFDECALNLAQVPADRVRPANHCLQDSLVADLAYGYRISGTSKDDAAAHLARSGIQGPKSSDLLDRVYAGNEERPVLMLNVWNACIAKLSGKP